MRDLKILAQKHRYIDPIAARGRAKPTWIKRAEVSHNSLFVSELCEYLGLQGYSVDKGFWVMRACRVSEPTWNKTL
jgi:hypothetical protein